MLGRLPAASAKVGGQRTAAAARRRCSACHGQHWWTERQQPIGWRCMTCHPPDQIRREGEGDDASEPAAPRAPDDRDTDPLFRQAGLSLDEEG